MNDDLDLDNLAQLKEILGERFSELIETFQSDAETRVATIRTALESSDLASIRHQAHGLKGSCRNIGANGLAELAATLEDQAHDASLENGLQQLAAVEQKLAAVNTQLDALIE